MTTSEPTCAVILRTSDGPCETCSQERAAGHAPPRGRDGELNHPYLGLKLGVCGHPLSAHGEAPEPNEPPFRMPWCVDCEQSGDAAMYANGAHAFETKGRADA